MQWSVPCSCLVLLAVACTDGPFGPGAEPLCSTRSDTAVVTFADARLESAVRDALTLLPGDRLTCALVTALGSLDASGRGIDDVGGIENLSGLETLRIRNNAITDIEPLRHLTGLTSLNLADNDLLDIGPLSDLTALTFLAINQNGAITDISSLSRLTNLTGTLWLAENAITSLDALGGLTGLTAINAWSNELSDIDAIGSLTGLTELRLHDNAITDIEPLRSLTRLTVIWLHSNPMLSDVGPLLGNPAVGPGVIVNLTATSVSCPDVATLEGRGATVLSDCP